MFDIAAHNPEPDEMKAILQNAKRVAVVGLSDNPTRTSHQIAQYLIDQGYEVIPVNPTVDEVFGRRSYKSLKEVEGTIDLVNVFRRSEYLEGIARETVDIGAKAFWAQLGLHDEKAYNHLKENDIPAVMNRCIMVEHRQALG